MKLLARIIVAIITNGLGLFLASQYIPRFELDVKHIESFFVVATTLMLLNFLLKPILKLILGPIIILTLGLGLILVNAIVLKVLDYLSEDLIIGNIPSLLLSGLLIGFVNFIFHLAQKD